MPRRHAGGIDDHGTIHPTRHFSSSCQTHQGCCEELPGMPWRAESGMKCKQVEIKARARSRLAFRWDNGLLRAAISPDTVGTYLLLRNTAPVYIGRSDTCLLSRLLGHPLRDCTTHVVWERTDSQQMAFSIEAYWFHRYRDLGALLNRIHPTVPSRSVMACPFCALEAISVTEPISGSTISLTTRATRTMGRMRQKLEE